MLAVTAVCIAVCLPSTAKVTIPEFGSYHGKYDDRPSDSLIFRSDLSLHLGSTMLRLTLFSALLFLVAAAADQARFEQWMRNHDKHYADLSERSKRHKIWLHNDQIISSHNTGPESPYQLGHNQFSDLSIEEFKARYTGLAGVTELEPVPDPRVPSELPAAVDWVEAGAVTPVKNQGGCGSC